MKQSPKCLAYSENISLKKQPLVTVSYYTSGDCRQTKDSHGLCTRGFKD